MLDQVTVRDLHYIVTVHQERHISRAAAAIPMAQPALSQALNRIEHRLGVQLFIRTSRAVTPTPAGDLFAARARTILDTLHSVICDARALTTPTEVTLYTTDSSLAVPRTAAAAIRRALPEVSVHDITVPRAHVAGMLADDSLGLSIGPREHAPGITTMLLCREPVVAFMDPHHQLAANDTVTIADVACYPTVQVNSAMSNWNDVVTTVFSAHGQIPQWTRSTVYGGAAATDLTRSSSAILMALHSIARSFPWGVSRPFSPAWTTPWYANWHADCPAAATIEQAVAAARNTLATRPGGAEQ